MAAEPETGIITDEALTMAAGTENSDAAVAEQFLAADVDAAAGATAAYVSGTAIRLRHRGSARRDRRRRTRGGDQAQAVPAAVAGGFTVDDFTVDEDAATVTCPAGHHPPITNPQRGLRCAVPRLPARAHCTTSKTGRTIILHEHDDLLRAARGDWAADPDLREDYRQYRPNVERVISQVASRGGRRLKLRYRGTAKNHAWLNRRTAALNLRNLIGRGLTRTAGVWTLTPQTA